MEIQTITTERALSVESPIGRLRLVASDGALTGLYFADDERGAAPVVSRAPRGSLLGRAETALGRYFDGNLERFELPLAPMGTPFQRAVWRALERIPFGQTRSYAEIARAIGRPDACRAVGAANGRNPISIVVPCHRVIGSDASLTGYGGGLAAKRWLLEHERR